MIRLGCVVALASFVWSEAPPAGAGFDYQIGGDYAAPAGVTTVTRDWFAGVPLEGDGTYSICYVNAFQTQPDEAGVDRRDERSNWPPALVLEALGDDPAWEGEYPIDISTPSARNAALDHVAPMIDTCAGKGFDAVELDNLDSWTRFAAPFGRDEAVAYATVLTDRAHRVGLAVAQKNTPEIGAAIARDIIGFDFAVAEECGYYDECAAYTAVYGDAVVVVEYTSAGFAAACASVGDRVPVVLRDVAVSMPDSPAYVFDSC